MNKIHVCLLVNKDFDQLLLLQSFSSIIKTTSRILCLEKLNTKVVTNAMQDKQTPTCFSTNSH